MDSDNKVFSFGQTLALDLIGFGATFVAVVFLFSMLMKYCPYRRDGETVESGERQVVGLDEVALKTLPVRKKHGIVEAGLEAPSCSICLSDFVQEENVKVIPNCKHEFHPVCVDKWLGVHPSCPLCRTSLGETVMEDEV